ncbi:hypothetical protein EV361DRAFT_507475 [Lentinula raphanica]|uniref:Uncharacterized protein n=1 Tax=Lentinula raphanica TaxID=153919 RepID=A0AA38PE26_9AGAR|nr:hypothetical protein F5878DRAFT_42415 [Lentinula raphanica]KAJ3967248.1 hypothetical protein EV361DRAFT_507475 [Lentinula raphanica]
MSQPPPSSLMEESSSVPNKQEQSNPEPQPNLLPAAKMLSLRKYGRVALGFIFPFKVSVPRAAERLPAIKELLGSTDPAGEIPLKFMPEVISRLHLFFKYLCRDIHDVWPHAFVCGVRDPVTSITMQGVMLTDNFDPRHSQIPTRAQVEQIQNILDWKEKLKWYHVEFDSDAM